MITEEDVPKILDFGLARVENVCRRLSSYTRR